MANRDILYRFEVKTKGSGGPRIQALQEDVRTLGMGVLRSANEIALYFAEGQMAPEELDLLGRFLFSDPVEERFEWREVRRGGGSGSAAKEPAAAEGAAATHSGRAVPRIVEICRKPGVTDPVAHETLRAARELGIEGLRRAATGVRWELEAEWLDEAALAKLTRVLFANPVIERWEFGEIEPLFPEEAAKPGAVERWDIAGMDDMALMALSAERRLALDLNEMKAIRAWYAAEGEKARGRADVGKHRAATDVELEMLAQTWSEHCVHKTFKADVEVRSVEGSPYPPVVRGIFNTYIKKTTEEIAAPWVSSAFVDNAGIVNFDDAWDLSFKVETHNHPSAVEPFGGANTGVGGVIRDIMGVSARPIAATDVLCFGPPDMDERELPKGSLHPRLIARGVVAGVEDYGNKMGIPTVNGGVHFHPGYAANPLVYCGCVGLAPVGAHRNVPRAGDRVIVLGGRTGRDGIRGATFSSMKMDGTTGDVAGASVQIGDPIVQKRALDVLLAARDAGIYDAVTDCGAGGLSSAVGEMASVLGAEIELAGIGTKYPGLAPWELWLSEAQERMVLAVPAGRLEEFAALCARFESEYWDIGAFGDGGALVLRMNGELVLELPMEFVHKGLPRKRLVAERPGAVSGQEIGRGAANSGLADTGGPHDASPSAESPAARLLKLLADQAVCSRERVVRRYDHEVQGGTAVKPFAGPRGDAPSDAAVLVPQGTPGTWGIAISNGLRPDYGERDPYRAAWVAVDEALRNAVAVGADPVRVAILDNFCMGDPNDPSVMWALLESARGLREAALAFGTPIISGKDSFYNEYLGPDGRRHAVPASLLVSALGFVPDARRALTSFLKTPGNSLWLAGDFAPVDADGTAGAPTAVPAVSDCAREVYRALHAAMAAGEVVSAHDLSEGGLGVALAEMCMGGRLGARVEFSESRLFSETAGCVAVEVARGRELAFAARFNPKCARRLGEVVADTRLQVAYGHEESGATSEMGVRGGAALSLSIGEMLSAWKGSAEEVLP